MCTAVCVKYISTGNVHRHGSSRQLVGLLSFVGRPCSSVRPAIPCVHTLSIDRVQVANFLNTVRCPLLYLIYLVPAGTKMYPISSLWSYM